MAAIEHATDDSTWDAFLSETTKTLLSQTIATVSALGLPVLEVLENCTQRTAEQSLAPVLLSTKN
ncbi:hypothetical protein ACFFQF_26795 [Haladaptatus pallidirubidus]|uniref:Transposase n=1 Tax=Haladaptatus pallidirubidus TaxID=1008152 RepID=A0AAV3UJX5_9EURY|nr:hypothetical protein [Haladaptatus pallidirubidus]